MKNPDTWPNGPKISKFFQKFSSTGKAQRESDILSLSPKELKRLKALPYLMPTTTRISGKNLYVTDPYWFVQCYQELWVNEIYRFRSKTSTPFILDCGANIGLSVIYFKYLYPHARIIAYEPDPTVFNALRLNVTSFGLENVTTIQKAVWSGVTEVLFEPDGSVGGSIAETRSKKTINVSTDRLRDWLDSPVDLLKMDIEGAEYEVLIDCRDRLQNIDYLFVEYHSKSQEPQRLHEILALLEEGGFRYHIKDASPIDHPFITEERMPYYDLQLNVFAFRS